MGHLDHAAFGWLTPVLSYVMACIGAALGLRCTVRALGATGRSRRNWLVTAASAIGTGIWTMHFVAMLGFSVRGTDIRYDVPLTILSLVVAMAVVSTGPVLIFYPFVQRYFVSGITIGVDMKYQSTSQLGAVTDPLYASDEVTWKTSSAAIATVDATGLVTFKKPGIVTITATTTDGSKIVGTDTKGVDDRVRFHHDDSVLLRYYNAPSSRGISKLAVSINNHVGFEGGGVGLPGPVVMLRLRKGEARVRRGWDVLRRYGVRFPLVLLRKLGVRLK
jgi:hypothetical protein